MKIISIFRTIDGEVTYRGPWGWSTFVRLGWCNLRCWKSTGFCDAPHSLVKESDFYQNLSLREVVNRILELKTPRVTITGGEPLLQANDVYDLAARLYDLGKIVTLETSGSLQFKTADLQDFHSVIMDVKCPSTEMDKSNKPLNMGQLRHRDYVKFVIEDRNDYHFALDYVDKHPTKAIVAFGPRWDYLPPYAIAKWLEEDERFDIQLNLQSHKYIWPNCDPSPVQKLEDVDVESILAKEK